MDRAIALMQDDLIMLALPLFLYGLTHNCHTSNPIRIVLQADRQAALAGLAPQWIMI